MKAIAAPKGASLIVFDGDDTLWISEPLYNAARKRAASVVGAQGLPAADWERLQRKVDLANAAHLGLSAQRFPLSCVTAYQILARVNGTKPAVEVEDEIRAVTCSLYQDHAPVVESAHRVLDELKGPYRLALLTQGEHWVQKLRVADSQLADYFDDIEIVAKKSTDDFVRLMKLAQSKPEASWSVGNSLASDINPALDAGMNAIWIDAPVWEYERRETVMHAGTVLAAKSLADVPTLLASAAKPLVEV